MSDVGDSVNNSRHGTAKIKTRQTKHKPIFTKNQNKPDDTNMFDRTNRCLECNTDTNQKRTKLYVAMVT